MRAIAAAVSTANASASATGITAFDQTTLPISLGAWVCPQMLRTTVDSGIWRHADTGTPVRNGVNFNIRTRGRGQFQTFGASSILSTATPGGIFSGGIWVHYGVSHDGTTVRFYRNGVQVHAAAHTSPLPTTGGTRFTAVGQPVSGLGFGIWDLRVAPGVTLSPGEMQALCDPRNGMRGCLQRLLYQDNWKVRGNGAVTLFDESGNGHHLTTSATDSEASQMPPPQWRRILFGRKVFYRAATTGAVLAGALSGSTTMTGALSVPKDLHGDLNGSAVITGALGVAKPLAGALSGASALVGALIGTVVLAGGFSGVSVIVGTLFVAAGPTLFMKMLLTGNSDMAVQATSYGSDATVLSTGDTDMQVSDINEYTGY